MKTPYVTIERHVLMARPENTRKVRVYRLSLILEGEAETGAAAACVATMDGAEEAAFRLYLEEQEIRAKIGKPAWEDYQIDAAVMIDEHLSTIEHRPAIVLTMTGETPRQEVVESAA